MGLFDTSRRLKRRVDDLETALLRVTATLEGLATEWQDTKDQVRRSYQRLEKAAQRAENAKTPCDEPQEPPEAEDPFTGRTDPFSRKVQQIRGDGALLPPQR